MDCITSPEQPTSKNPRPWVFLGGGIKGCPEWQLDARDALADQEMGSIINPRRYQWDPDEQGIAVNQIEWEFHSIFSADIFSVWFCREDTQPECMFQLGSALARFRMADQRLKALVIGVHPGFELWAHLEKQVGLALEGIGEHKWQNVLLGDELEEHIDNIKASVEKVWRDSGYARTC